MLDNAIITLIIQALVAGEATAGIPGLPIKQAFQPTQEGAATAATAYIHKVGDARYGSPFWRDTFDTGTQIMTHTETQQYLTTFQLGALSPTDPADTTAYTASDICNLCAAILQSQSTVTFFQNSGIGITRVGEVRNPYFLDDTDQNEASPSFDFIIAHNQVLSSVIPSTATIEIDSGPVE